MAPREESNQTTGQQPTNNSIPMSDEGTQPPPLLSAEIKSDLHLDDRCMLTDASFAKIPCRVVGVNTSKAKCIDAGAETHEGDYVPHSRDELDLSISSRVHYSFGSCEAVGGKDVKKHVVIAAPVELDNLLPIEPGATCWVIGAGGYNTMHCTLGGKKFATFDEMISHLQKMYSEAGGKVVVVSSIVSGFVIPKNNGNNSGGGNLTKLPSSMIQNEKAREWYKRTITPVSSSFFLWVLDVCKSVVMEKEPTAAKKTPPPAPSETGRVLREGQEMVDAGFKKMMEKDFSKMGFSKELLSDINYLKSTVSSGGVGGRTGKWAEYFAYCEDPCAELTDMVSFALMRSPHLAEFVPYTTAQGGRFPAAVDADPSYQNLNTAELVAKYGYLLRLRPGAFSKFVELLNQFMNEWWTRSCKKMASSL